MIDHLGLQVADVEASARLLGTVLAPLGIAEQRRIPTPGGPVVAFGPDGGQEVPLWLSGVVPGPDGGPPAGRETHLALTARDRAAVDAVHGAALGAGVEILHPPREWPEYHPGYYAVFFRDLDGNNLEVVHHG
ncbi:VOC family protein [Nakamurella leprariae]|uniref:VOC family protein n=1 Tax=Nakamurella leprariae TaxID=2803911 RepID=A0A938YED2_9ACTN|nr:VOC family protein [Nakamurella leprariae]MBM9466218.1 VOC family protein [Nakamurella leprariae]